MNIAALYPTNKIGKCLLPVTVPGRSEFDRLPREAAMTYREEKGTVIQVKRQRAVVQMDAPASSACRGCGLCAHMGSDTRTMEVDGDGLREGDRVLVRIPRHSGYTGMLLLVVVPMLLFVAGMLAGLQMFPDGGGLPALVGVGGLVAGFGVSWLVEKLLPGGSVEVRRLERGLNLGGVS